jgi:hypothetical protein
MKYPASQEIYKANGGVDHFFLIIPTKVNHPHIGGGTFGDLI